LRDRFPFTIPAIRQLKEIPFHPAVTFIIGQNGSGKSTLLEAIAVRLNFDDKGGDADQNFGIRDLDGGLHDYIIVEKNRRRHVADHFFLRAETVFDLATKIDQRAETDWGVLGQYGHRSLHSLSHGEMFLAVIQNRMREESFFILDEPEAALSPSRQLTVLKEMDYLVRQGCQFVIATHSPILLAYPDADIWELGDHGVRKVEYEETEHYTLTRAFLENTDAFLHYLIE